MVATGHLDIRGVAHPRPPRGGGRRTPADLNAAEIRSTNLTGRPLLNEHNHDARVGTCLASWEGKNGELRMAARVTDPAAIRDVKQGKLRGLSLGTDMLMADDGGVLYRGQSELSICAEGKRPGTWIDTIDNRVMHQTHRASLKGAARR